MRVYSMNFQGCDTVLDLDPPRNLKWNPCINDGTISLVGLWKPDRLGDPAFLFQRNKRHGANGWAREGAPIAPTQLRSDDGLGGDHPCHYGHRPSLHGWLHVSAAPGSLHREIPKRKWVCSRQDTERIPGVPIQRPLAQGTEVTRRYRVHFCVSGKVEFELVRFTM